ncbi:MAG: cation:proton antiporter [Spongiibacteraceae bacterium]|nr:cation:proton antiporter [Spongiibacteraceae bacterium]
MVILAETLMLAAVLLPLLAVVGILLFRRYPNIREAVSLVTAAVLFSVVLLLYLQVIGGAAVRADYLTILPGLSLSLEVRPLGLLFALIASLLWFVTILYAIGYMRAHEEENQTRFYAFFAFALAAVMGLALSENLFTLFIFYELITLGTYPLVTHAGSEKALKGGRSYLRFLLGTSIVFFLPAMIGTWFYAGTLSFTPGGVFGEEVPPLALSILLLLFVFGVGKAAVMPFHRWLPAAMVAPTPVSALLHAVAVVKAGVFTLLMVCIYLFGANTLSSLATIDYLLYLIAFGILMASIIAMQQDNLKARLAYSTVSQLGYISLGALLASSSSIAGSALHIAMHAFGKITLFFCAGAILVASHKTCVSELRGLGRQMPVTMAAFFVGSLSIIGLPPTGGMWSKWYLLLGTLERDQLVLMVVLLISSLLNIAYLLPIGVKAFFPGEPAVASVEVKEAPLPSLIAIVFTSVVCVVLFLWPQLLPFFGDFTQGIVDAPR